MSQSKVIKLTKKCMSLGLHRFGNKFEVGPNLTIRFTLVGEQPGKFEPMSKVLTYLIDDEIREVRRLLRINGFHKHANVRVIPSLIRNSEVA